MCVSSVLHAIYVMKDGCQLDKGDGGERDINMVSCSSAAIICCRPGPQRVHMFPRADSCGRHIQLLELHTRCDSEPLAHDRGWWGGMVGRGLRKCPGIYMLSDDSCPACGCICSWITRREIPSVRQGLLGKRKLRGQPPQPIARRCRSPKARSLALGAFGIALACVGVGGRGNSSLLRAEIPRRR